jgi:Zn-dependent protease
MIGGDPRNLLPMVLFFIPALLIGFTLHEAAHALVANAQGDPTAKNLGRLTLNPIRHLDPLGVVMLVLAGVGYAKPVPVNPANLKGQLSRLLVALAGPGANLVVAVAVSIPLKLIAASSGVPVQFDIPLCSLTAPPLEILKTELTYIYTLNLLLMVFNLLPIPPLDGFELVRTVLRRSNPRLLFQIESNRQTIYIVLILAFLLVRGALFFVLLLVANPAASLLGVPLHIWPCT